MYDYLTPAWRRRALTPPPQRAPVRDVTARTAHRSPHSATRERDVADDVIGGRRCKSLV